MKKVFKKTFMAFTIIELMVSIFLTLAIIGTFYKLYNNSLKTARASTIRASVNMLGEQLVDIIANSMRLTGLGNDSSDFNDSSGSPILNQTQGGNGTDTVIFKYLSPYGGPITKLYESASGDDASSSCAFEIYNSAAFHAGVQSVNLMTKSKIYKASVDTSSIVFNDTGISFNAVPQGASGKCEDSFPAGILVTGDNNEFELSYDRAGTVTRLKLTAKTLVSGVEKIETYINFSSEKSSYKIPHFVLQYLREYEDSSGTITRTWSTVIDDSVERKDIKAVRIGFVAVSKSNRIKVASEAPTDLTTYCVFSESPCYKHTNPNETAYVFRRVIYLRNYDYLKINNG